MKNLKHIPREKLQEFVMSFDYVFLDMGVLQNSKSSILGSDLFVQLRKLGKKCAVVTNDCFAPKKSMVDKLSDFELQDEELVGPNDTLISHFKKINFDKDIYVIGSLNMKNVLRQAGFNVLEIKPDVLENGMVELKNDCLRVAQNYTNIGAVVVDCDLNFTLLLAQRAITLLNHNKDSILLYGANDECGSIAKGATRLGCKFYVDAIRRLGNREGVGYAKSSPLFTEHLKKKYNIIDPSRVLYVGDNFQKGVTFGHESGYQTLLVQLSGQTHEKIISHWEDNDDLVKPDFYVRSLNEFNDLLAEHCQ